ncbi:unnamed protein product [Nesidiocoris tenuis]|uniref:Uncharacterized protein n=1 Tax=Nesidiocoris tenuis TaxID=355587 RepID=A0A6H5HD24_9HEMI|nr:unnamed protein product [Nesidiocoris tenuis]
MVVRRDTLGNFNTLPTQAFRRPLGRRSGRESGPSSRKRRRIRHVTSTTAPDDQRYKYDFAEFLEGFDTNSIVFGTILRPPMRRPLLMYLYR